MTNRNGKPDRQPHNQGGTTVATSTATPEPEVTETEAPAKPKRDKNVNTPYAMTKVVNQMFADRGIINPETGEIKKIGSPMMYIYREKGAFKATHHTADGTDRWEVDVDSFMEWAEEYVTSVENKLKKGKKKGDAADEPSGEAPSQAEDPDEGASEEITAELDNLTGDGEPEDDGEPEAQ